MICPHFDLFYLGPKAKIIAVVSEFYAYHIHLICLFVCIEAQCPSQQFFSHIGTEPMDPGFNQYGRELMCLAQ